jgi:hypothetical protein
MYYKLICILYALLCGQIFILVKSGCYTRQSGQSRLEQPERGTKQHKGGPTVATLSAHRGDPTSSSFISESRPGDLLHALHLG